MTNSRRELLLTVGAVGMAVSAGAADTKPAQDKSAGLDSEKFRQAVLAGDLSTVTSMLDRDPALRYARDADGVSVYTLACLKGQPKIAEELVRRGLVLDIFEAAAGGNTPRVNELSKDNALIARQHLPDDRTPLHLAAAAGKADMVTALATRAADLSAGPESPLLTTLNYPDHAVASAMSSFLLVNASDPNARRRDGKTALHLAAARGYDDLVQMLIHRGAATDVRDVDGKTPLDVATGSAIPVLQQASSIERVSYARRYTQDQRGNPVTRDDNYGLPQELINQFSSVAHNDFEKVKQLQKLCPMLVMTRATWDELGIEAAAHMGLVPMAKYLADLGAPVSTCTATLVGAHDLVKRLLTEDPACIRERGAHDLPLLAYTAYGDQRVDTAELLLKAGADVHVKAFGQTTLHLCARKGHVELAQLLLERGADVNATFETKAGLLTPLGLAVQAKQSKMTDFLKDHGAHL
jgi:ankyrin repeat protein